MDFNLSFPEVELKEETEIKFNGSQHFVDSTSSMNNHDNDASKELLFALDEAHFLLHDSLIYDPHKQVQPSVHTKLEGFSQVDKAGETENVLKVQEPEDNMLPSPLQKDESSSQLAVENSVEDVYETNITPGTEEQTDTIMYEERAYINEMDEELLSELDVVGDFSVQNISMNSNRSYSDHEVNSNILEEVEAEVNFGLWLHYFDSTSLIDITEVQNSESSTLNGDPNLEWSKELISDSYVGDVSAGLLVLEQSSQDIDVAFKKVCEEVQNFDADESVQTEGIDDAFKKFLHGVRDQFLIYMQEMPTLVS